MGARISARLKPDQLQIGSGSTQSFDLGFDLRERGFESGAARWIRSSLREDIFALQLKRLFLSFLVSAVQRGLTPVTVACGTGNRILHGTCHLFLHGFTFPATSHSFILRGFEQHNPAV